MKNKTSKLVRDAYRALRLAVAEALADHKRAGNPIYVWENGKVVRIPANRIRLPRKRKAA